jgi:hypothetical protein
MNSRVFPRRDVRDFLSGLVCLKIKDGSNHPDEKRLNRKFGIRAYPTLVLLDAEGKVLHNDSGAPSGDQFILSLGYEPYDAMIKAYNGRRWAEAANHCHFLRTYFKGTKPIGEAAEQIYNGSKRQKAFLQAFAAAGENHKKALAKAREDWKRQQIEKERKRIAMLSAKARPLKEEADRLYKKTRYKSYAIYKKVIWEYPETPEAKAAREILKKHKKKWKEPQGEGASDN